MGPADKSLRRWPDDWVAGSTTRGHASLRQPSEYLATDPTRAAEQNNPMVSIAEMILPDFFHRCRNHVSSSINRIQIKRL
jgi:hypothetical protein